MNKRDTEDGDSFLNTNDFEIIERFSDDDDSSSEDLPSPTYHSLGFPEVKHRSVSDFNFSNLKEHDELLGKSIEEMNEAEIKEVQNYLYEKLGKETCEFIKQRKLKRIEESKLSQQSQTDNKSDEVYTPSTKGLVFKSDKKEFQKYEWMTLTELSPKDEKPGQLKLHQLRFNFEGLLAGNSEDEGSYDPALYNHGDEPDKPGYTLPELVHLSQSSFKSQAQISVRTLANILFHSYYPHEGERCFFSYSQYRWNNYVYNDLNLVSRVCYLLCEAKLSLSVLIDTLRVLSLLLFGDSSVFNNLDNTESIFLVPVQDLLFDYHQFYLGIDVYFWNPLFVEFFQTDILGEGVPLSESQKSSLVSTLELKLQRGSVEEFGQSSSEKLLEGNEDSKDFSELVDDVFLFLYSCTVVNKLLVTMNQYKDNPKVQIYCISSICGLLSHCGKPLADALGRFDPFKAEFEVLADSLIGSNTYGKWTVHLTGFFLYLVKYMAVYLSDLGKFFKTSSAVSVIKHTITKAFWKDLMELGLISDLFESENEVFYKKYASTAVKCLTVWALRGYLFDSLDELLPLLNLSMFRIKEYFTDDNLLNSYLTQNSELLSCVLIHLSTIMRLNEMQSHFEYNGLVGKVNELINLFSSFDKWNEHSSYYLYSLLQFQYDHVTSVDSLEDLESWEFRPDSLVSLVGKFVVMCQAGLDLPERLVNLAWFEDNMFSGRNTLLYNESLVKKDLDRVVLPFNILNLALNTLLRARNLGHKINCEDVLNQKLTDLSVSMIKVLRKMYFVLHETGFLYLNSKAYMVKSFPFLESWLAYLTTAVHFGIYDFDTFLSVMAFSVDFGLIEEVLNLLRDKYGFNFEGSLDSFKKLNDYLSGYSISTNGLPLVSFLSYLTYLPMNDTLSSERGLGGSVEFVSKVLSSEFGPKLLEWTFPSFQFAQLTYFLSSKQERIGDSLTPDHYLVFQRLLFDGLSSPCHLRVVESDYFLDRWEDSLDKFELNTGYTGKKLSECFRNNDEMTFYFGKLLNNFNSGLQYSPVTIGLIMLFTSYMSNEESSRLLWSDESAMLLIGRNLTFDFDTFEVRSTLVSTFNIGNMFTFASFFESEVILRSQRKLMESFSKRDFDEMNPVMFLTLLSVYKNMEELEDLDSERLCEPMRELIKRLGRKRCNK